MISGRNVWKHTRALTSTSTRRFLLRTGCDLPGVQALNVDTCRTNLLLSRLGWIKNFPLSMECFSTHFIFNWGWYSSIANWIVDFYAFMWRFVSSVFNLAKVLLFHSRLGKDRTGRSQAVAFATHTGVWPQRGDRTSPFLRTYLNLASTNNIMTWIV